MHLSSIKTRKSSISSTKHHIARSRNYSLLSNFSNYSLNTTTTTTATANTNTNTNSNYYKYSQHHMNMSSSGSSDNANQSGMKLKVLLNFVNDNKSESITISD
eukprot:413299_1